MDKNMDPNFYKCMYILPDICTYILIYSYTYMYMYKYVSTHMKDTYIQIYKNRI